MSQIGWVSQIGRLAAKAFRNQYGCSPLQLPYEIDIGYGKPHITLVYAYPPCDLELVDRAIDTIMAKIQEQEKERDKRLLSPVRDDERELEIRTRAAPRRLSRDAQMARSRIQDDHSD